MKKGDISISVNALSKEEKKKKIIRIFLITIVSISILFSILNIVNTAVKVHNFKLEKFSPNVVRAQVSVCFDVAPPEMDELDDNVSVYIGDPFSLKINATSPSNRTVYFYDNTTLFEINESTGWINFTPVGNDSGNYFVMITATHNICDVNTSDSMWFLIQENNAPIWLNNTPVNQTLIEDEIYTFNLSQWVYDIDNDTITFSSNASTDFPNFNLTSNGLLNFTPDDIDVGLHAVIIYANDSYDLSPKLFMFNVINVEEPPILIPFPNQFSLCEHENFYYNIDATDEDLNIPNTMEKLFFYDNTTLFVINEQTGEIFFSPDIENPEQTENIPVRVYVTDEEELDYQDTSFFIVPINDAPVMNVIPAKTVWVNETLDFYVDVYDEEDGSNYDGNMNFTDNTTLFNITNDGRIVYDAKIEDNGTYFIEICARDNGIPVPNNASLCGNDYNPKTVCQNLSLTITDVNRPPVITSYVPSRQNLQIYEGENITFIITKYDPDGTIPTTYWLVNNVTVIIGPDLWIFETMAGDAGNYIIKAEISDGMLNDSTEWYVTVLTVPPSSGGGGGGGSGGCRGIWNCSDWFDCSNFSKMFVNISEISYSTWQSLWIKDCIEKNISLDVCGLQLRHCTESSGCNNADNRPADYMACSLLPGPSCSDGVRNCHNGFCEILIDCGGPCAPCPGEMHKEESAGSGKSCPDKKCSLDEIFTCWNDCYLFWIITIISILAVAALVFVVRRKFLKGEEPEEKKPQEKHRKLI